MNRAKVLLLLCLLLILSACRSLENTPAEKPAIDLPAETPIELPVETPTELSIELPTELPTLPPVEDEVDTGAPGYQVPQPPNLLPVTPPTQEETPIVMPELPSAPSGMLDSLVEQARKDLAKRLSISVSQITVVQAREVTWQDSSLGCPKDGMMYLMVLSPGFQIILRAEGREYNYHAGLTGGAFYCESPTPPASG